MADATEGLAFVLPVLGQEKTLAASISAWTPVLEGLNRPYEILIVDDGSTDGTRAQADAAAARNKNIRVLSHPDQRGFGACLKTAIAESTQPLVFYTSCDPGWNPGDLPRLIKSLSLKDEFTQKHVELANGHRRGIALPAGRARLNWLYRYATRILFGYLPERPKGWLGVSENRYWWRCRQLFGTRIGDLNSKFKLFRRSILDRMELQSNGEFIHTELLAKANFLGYIMDEIVLSDRTVPSTTTDVRQEMRRVFQTPKFRSPVPTPGL